MPDDGDSEDLGLGEDRALAMRLAPGLVVHAADRVGLDLHEPLYVDVRPVLGLRAKLALGTYTTLGSMRRAWHSAKQEAPPLAASRRLWAGHSCHLALDDRA